MSASAPLAALAAMAGVMSPDSASRAMARSESQAAAHMDCTDRRRAGVTVAAVKTVAGRPPLAALAREVASLSLDLRSVLPRLRRPSEAAASESGDGGGLAMAVVGC